MLFGQRFRVDAFQRSYRWERKHIEALIDDITSSFFKCYKDGDIISSFEEYDCYYLGPIVLCRTDKDISIIDGQQRLTSITLILIYLKHLITQLNISPDITRDFDDFIYVRRGGSRTYVLNIESRISVMDYLMKLDSIDDFDERILSESNSDKSIDNILDRYQDVVSLFPDSIKTPEILPIFVEWLLEKIVVVEIMAYSMDNAYTIFETMNDRGLNLSPTEILKGYLLSKIIEGSRKDDGKAIEASNFWTSCINRLHQETNSDGIETDFFKFWLRGKYAETKRQNKAGAENEDFEKIATHFHSWVKNNSARMNLRSSDEFYYFIMSDLDFYVNLFLRVYNLRRVRTEGFEILYENGFYTIADSLYYPLFISAISKIDDKDTIDLKIKIIANFLDRYTNIRSLYGKSINQSSIRNNIYELVKSIRNAKPEDIKAELDEEIKKQIASSFLFENIYSVPGNTYLRYLLARITYTM